METLSEKLKELYRKQNDLNDEIRKAVIKEAEDLGINIKVETKEEYDDNNYFTIGIISEVNGESVHWDSGMLMDEFSNVVKQLEEIEIPNTLDLITEGDTVIKKAKIARSMLENDELEFSWDSEREMTEFLINLMEKGKDIKRAETLLHAYLDDYQLFT